MATVREIYQYLDGLAPFSLQMEFDNAGFLVGRGERAVSKILVSLDITEEVAEEAAELGAELIVSHHPVIFRPAKSVTDGDPDGRVLLALAEHRIAAICAHTNLDAVAGASMTPWPKSWDWCRLSSSIRTGWMAPGVPTASAGWAVPPAPPCMPPPLLPLSRRRWGPTACATWTPAARCAGWPWGRRLRRPAAGCPGPGVRHLCHRRREV